MVGHGPKSMMVAVIGKSHPRISSQAFSGRISTRKIASSHLQFYLPCSWLFFPSEKIQQAVMYVDTQWSYFLIISLIVVVNIRLPRKPVQYGAFSSRAMINVRVDFLTQCRRGYKRKKLHHLFYEELPLDLKPSYLSPFLCYVRLKFGNCEEPTWASHDVM